MVIVWSYLPRWKHDFWSCTWFNKIETQVIQISYHRTQVSLAMVLPFIRNQILIYFTIRYLSISWKLSIYFMFTMHAKVVQKFNCFRKVNTMTQSSLIGIILFIHFNLKYVLTWMVKYWVTLKASIIDKLQVRIQNFHEVAWRQCVWCHRNVDNEAFSQVYEGSVCWTM